ncbi:MAG: hypothetical protein IV100_27670 [Myxococcales bacterium]|nr:hypothetical protein [Myxococcales bacterium]
MVRLRWRRRAGEAGEAGEASARQPCVPRQPPLTTQSSTKTKATAWRAADERPTKMCELSKCALFSFFPLPEWLFEAVEWASRAPRLVCFGARRHRQKKKQQKIFFCCRLLLPARAACCASLVRECDAGGVPLRRATHAKVALRRAGQGEKIEKKKNVIMFFFFFLPLCLPLCLCRVCLSACVVPHDCERRRRRRRKKREVFFFLFLFRFSSAC